MQQSLAGVTMLQTSPADDHNNGNFQQAPAKKSKRKRRFESQYVIVTDEYLNILT